MAARDPDRRHKIIEAARRIFARHGYEGASISMIAAETGLTKAALYHHFTSKEAIYRASSRTGMDELLMEVGNALDKTGPHPIDRLRAYMHASAARFERNQDSWMSGSAIFWTTHSSETRSEVLRVRDEYEGVLKDIIHEGMASGVFRKDIDVDLSSKFLLSIVNQLPRWYRKGGKYSAVEIIDIYLDTYLNGVLDTARTPCLTARTPVP
ncbi:TetR/AcrR family transcriptional regulator [Parapusillimonas granuli]|uniref:TetR/AcrR family transcriptional regulator n=1 Tax=Parapusillimonas granuli TaxID=380911 RepID=A0A853FZB7_9BURK|nr:TetR/AcrR family transcriptional regulator [Parapusillimonas granuli]MBB5216534.1 AcrR family transcriptional regulator [Parapusillimonas granuli]MEB2399723.1 TetR/AcrR family transcriptional regulator [Alcaligenaceae bacterium]NYT48160.1 TetR/AcrR family transcriptional regulator [Parapusillimonas granuli]